MYEKENEEIIIKNNLSGVEILMENTELVQPIFSSHLI